MRKEFVVLSEYDGLPLQGVVYEPNEKPRGIVQLVHGMVEYKKRYEPFMQFLAERGYVAACHDHRGHGDSVATEEDRGWFGDRTSKAIVNDCAQVTKYLKTQYPDLPVTLFGHSMGSMVVRCYLHENDGLIDKLIVCGSPSYNPMAGTAVLLAKTMRLFRGERHRSKTLNYLATGKGSEEFVKAGKGSWLTRDEEIVRAYHENPKCRFVFTVNGFENLFNLMKYTYKKSAYKVQNPALPIHFIAGSDDVVIVSPEKWEKAVEFIRKVGYPNVTRKLYPDMRHELLNEIGREEVYADVLEFIEKEPFAQKFDT